MSDERLSTPGTTLHRVHGVPNGKRHIARLSPQFAPCVSFNRLSFKQSRKDIDPLCAICPRVNESTNDIDVSRVVIAACKGVIPV